MVRKVLIALLKFNTQNGYIYCIQAYTVHIVHTVNTVHTVYIEHTVHTHKGKHQLRTSDNRVFRIFGLEGRSDRRVELPA